jgi:glycosyltransferase involved in cell wall biosynthesis
MIRRAALSADALVTVSGALRKVLEGLGVPGERIAVLRNGVDLSLFHPGGRGEARGRLGFAKRTLLSVGNLLPLKGHHLAIEALATLGDVDLVIVGEGPEREALANLARGLRVDGRVRFTGALPQTALREYYAAADALVLASSREGWPNVLLESMACGTPVVATRVGGTPEIVASPEAGELMRERTREALADAVGILLARAPDRARTRAYAEGYSWDATTRGQIELFERVVARRSSRGSAVGESLSSRRATTLSHR